MFPTSPSVLSRESCRARVGVLVTPKPSAPWENDSQAVRY